MVVVVSKGLPIEVDGKEPVVDLLHWNKNHVGLICTSLMFHHFLVEFRFVVPSTLHVSFVSSECGWIDEFKTPGILAVHRHLVLL